MAHATTSQAKDPRLNGEIFTIYHSSHPITSLQWTNLATLSTTRCCGVECDLQNWLRSAAWFVSSANMLKNMRKIPVSVEANAPFDANKIPRHHLCSRLHDKLRRTVGKRRGDQMCSWQRWTQSLHLENFTPHATKWLAYLPIQSYYDPESTYEQYNHPAFVRMQVPSTEEHQRTVLSTKQNLSSVTRSHKQVRKLR